MEFLFTLLRTESVAHTVLILSLVAVLGLALGQFRIFKMNLGIAGVLFSGLLFGHFHFSISEPILDFTREFGLILFVYTIGLQVGPGFFSSLRKQGMTLNMLAASVVFMGVATAWAICHFGHVPALAAVGLYSGATTNTPSLGAAQQALKDLPNIPAELLQLPGLGYAMAYPFGIMGIILVMMLMRILFRVNVQAEAEAILNADAKQRVPLRVMNLEVQNANLEGLPLESIPGWPHTGVVISRHWHGGETVVPGPDTVLHQGDVLLAVGDSKALEALRIIVGVESQMDLRTIPSDVVTRRVLVTRKGSTGKPLSELDFIGRFGINLTRVIRGDIELAASPRLTLQMGDSVLLVGEEADMGGAIKELGNSQKHLNHPRLLPVFIGIGLGVLLGSWPVHLPGVPAPIKLGLAGGPLIVAMLLARTGRIGPLVWYMPMGANFMLREIGIVLFLACVGLRAGDQFFRTLFYGGGWTWMLYGSLITLVPLLIGALVARLAFKVNYLSMCGFLAGSMTDPPALAFAGALAPSDAPAISYATVYPLVMLLRVLTAQLLVLFLAR